MSFALNHIALAVFNIINSRIDPYRILKNKSIAHGINFGAYALFTSVVGYLFIRHVVGLRCVVSEIIVFAISAFCNRQFSFDIPLNIRRFGVEKWDYVSLAKPPKFFLDRWEIRLFGYNGRAPLVMYGTGFMICILIKMAWL